jgi:hypothetical protein
MKTFLYKWFGVGRIPESLLNELKGETIVASDEGIRSTITYLNFRAPGRYSNWKRRWLTGGLVLTDQRLVLLKYATPVVNITLADERFRRIQVSTEAEDRLLLAFTPDLFLENSSGNIEWRFRTRQARKIADALNGQMK